MGGFPIRLRADRSFSWCGSLVTAEEVRENVRRALGLSAVLTYTNKSLLSLEQLGDLCVERGHDWAFHWMTLSLLFVGYGLPGELSFARAGGFFLSWPVEKVASGRAFVASASLKTWGWHLANRESSDFDDGARRAMCDAHTVLSDLLPRKTRP